ncbi:MULTISPECIES: histidine phosphatase family protein [Micrococcaceae]|uniref:histidine phosphatase family protein n=1 Tax=Micrococcaceae TaxID=1268 RepID=UPI001CFFBB9A|nr:MULTISPECIES: histidine phosphatase family protein [Micrococcaceae]MCB5282787.1 Phosphoserine phosphatase 1 [Arthrobacter sp. ES1]MDJ0353578.1 histidine phosphatase family protein [Pseudarthrobacter sp. PH31-O2]WGZ79027.1 histidine phosphatase family protein [Arthrobacter sp. EM1]
MTSATSEPSAEPRRQGTLLLLVRHGETPTTGTVLPGRAPGLHLSDRGRAQAERVAERLTGLSVSALYSSPLERARETAEPTAARTGLEVQHEPGLLECDFGDWTGAAIADLAVLPEWRTVQNNPSTFRFPHGESFTEMQDRIVGSLAALCVAHPGGVVVCFSHADTIKAAVAHALGTPLDLFQRIMISPGSVSAVQFVDGQPSSVPMVNSHSEPLSKLRPR